MFVVTRFKHKYMKYLDVILVDLNNNQLGVERKGKAHKLGLLHKAFSIFVINSNREVLLQKRAKDKYHSPGLWSNTCCSHHQLGVDIGTTLKDRLLHEMGIEVNKFKHLFNYYYKYKFNSDLYEHEYDEIYLAYSDHIPKVNKDEVGDFRWVSIDILKNEIFKNPQKFTIWLRSIIVPFESILALHINNFKTIC